MSTEYHNRLLGIFYSIYGGLMVCGGLAVMALALTTVTQAPDGGPQAFWVTARVPMILGLALLVFGLVPVVVGVGLLQERSWARIASIVVAIFIVANFPLGMALGIYTLSFMFSAPARRLYLTG
jgi:hypothetical protein